MNKKIIITALLSLVALAGQAQMKSGLDLCLRDEATGEWLIGLFDDLSSSETFFLDFIWWNRDFIVYLPMQTPHK
ncbi:MAG: hypothetical protein IJ767_00895 [Bacteroidaceae bacterium]|nr:hypothetical protein [Bacteroidaceae bacterium]